MARLPRIFIAYKWRIPKAMWALLLLEFPLTVACLTLFGIADQDTYRTTLWQNGYDKGFNSAPNEILYDYANYRTPHTPLIWSSGLTQFNIVVSVLSTFVLLVKATMFVLHAWIPLLSLVVSLVELVLYAVSIHDQTAPDMSDPAHPSPGLPWYLGRGCGYAEPGVWGYCMQARASFALTCVMVVLYAAYVGFACWSLRPTPEEKAIRDADREEDIEMKKYLSYGKDAALTKEERWEKNRQIFLNLPKTPNTPGFGMKNPMTPRTVAFTALEGGPTAQRSVEGGGSHLPFRHYNREVGRPDAR